MKNYHKLFPIGYPHILSGFGKQLQSTPSALCSLQQGPGVTWLCSTCLSSSIRGAQACSHDEAEAKVCKTSWGLTQHGQAITSALGFGQSKSHGVEKCILTSWEEFQSHMAECMETGDLSITNSKMILAKMWIVLSLGSENTDDSFYLCFVYSLSFFFFFTFSNYRIGAF